MPDQTDSSDAPTQVGAPVTGGADPALRLDGVSKSFDGRAVLDDIDLDVAPGEFLVIVGPSGCGKSTLLRLAAELERPSLGTVEAAAPRAVGFQDSRLVPWLRTWENVVFGIPGSRRSRRTLADRALAEVGLTAFADAWPGTLSGGQAQRVSLARTLTIEPRLLLLDEPFGALDALSRLNAQSLVQRLWRTHGFAAVLVTHDVEEAVILGSRIIVIDAGRIADEFVVELPRPRRRSQAGFDAHRTRILDALGVDETAE